MVHFSVTSITVRFRCLCRSFRSTHVAFGSLVVSVLYLLSVYHFLYTQSELASYILQQLHIDESTTILYSESKIPELVFIIVERISSNDGFVPSYATDYKKDHHCVLYRCPPDSGISSYQNHISSIWFGQKSSNKPNPAFRLSSDVSFL